MTRQAGKMFEKFRRYWKHYVFQCLLATFVVFIVLLALSLKNAVIISSIGATAFIIFAMPKMMTANPRNVIGGQATGLISRRCRYCRICNSPSFRLPFIKKMKNMKKTSFLFIVLGLEYFLFIIWVLRSRLVDRMGTTCSI